MQRRAVGASGEDHHIGAWQLRAPMITEVHPGVAAGRQQRVEQCPVVDRQVPGHRQRPADLRSQRWLDLAHLAAGEHLDGPSLPGQLLADPI
jgi:hypothetical protein